MEIKDYLHLYLGCQVSVSGKEWINNGFIGKLTGIKEDQLLTEYKGYGWVMHEWITFKKCKLILRPLGSMTEEESKYWDENFPELPEDVVDAANQTLWLLSKHFDMFGLIEAGLAIDATTITIPA